MSNLKIFLLSLIMVFALVLIALAQETTPEAMETVELDENIQAQDLGIGEPKILPDSHFYFLKSWARGIQSFFTFNSVAKSELKEKFANEKLLELKKTIEQKKNAEVIKKAVENYQQEVDNIKEQVEKIKETAAENPKVDSFLDKFIQQQTLHQKLLQKLETQVPAQSFEKIKEARDAHLENFQGVMLKLEDRPEKITEKLDKILEEQKGSQFKNFKNLEILKNLEEKVPEQAKEAIQKAEENALKRLQGDLEKMSPEDQEKFKEYTEKISGEKEKHLEILEDVKSEIKRMPEATGTIQLQEKLEKGKAGILEKIDAEGQQIGCPAWTFPIPPSGFCTEGRVVIMKDTNTGCPIPPRCIIPGETAILPSKAPAGPLDTALAVVTILSVKDKIADIRIEEIRDYQRYPRATYPQLKVGDKISVKFNYVAPETPTGSGAKAVKEGEPPSITPQPKPITNKKYLASMSMCLTEHIGGLSCGYEGWSASIYPITPPPIEPITPPSTGITPPSTGIGSTCITLWDPVCGKNGKTYSNKCFAKLAGAEMDYKGVCQETKCPEIKCVRDPCPRQHLPDPAGCVNCASPCPSGTITPTKPTICIQVITPALSPEGICKEFPTPCDVPAGWEKVDSCADETSIPSKTTIPSGR